METGVVDLYRKSILLIAFVLPSALYPLTLVIVAVTLICWFLVGDHKKLPALIKEPQLLWPSLFYLYIAGGFFFADHFGYALTSLSVMAPIALFPLLVGTSSVIDSKLVREAGKAFVLSIIVFLLIALAYAVIDVLHTGKTSVLVEESVYNKFSSYGLTRVFDSWHPTYVAMFANIAIAIQLEKALDRSRDKKRLVLTTLVFVFLSGCIILLDSIIAFVAYFALLGYYSLKVFDKLKLNLAAKAFILGTLLLICGAVFYFNPLQLDKIEKLKSKEFKITDKEQERNILTMRMAKWEVHWDIVKQHWLWGVTSGDIRIKRKELYVQKGFNDLARHNYNAHNEYLEVLATYGLVGFMLFFCMLLVPLLKTVYPLYYPFLIIVSITFATESLLSRQQGILAIMFLYALYTHSRVGKRQSSRPAKFIA